MPHKCHGNGGNCPSRSHPIWELPINELDRRDDPDVDEKLSGCHLVSSCSNIYHKDQFRRLLQHNFDRHYNTNRAPLSLSFDASWLVINKGFLDVLDEWISDINSDYSDAYFVTHLQVLQWIMNPTSTQGIRNVFKLKSYFIYSFFRVERLQRMEEQVCGEGSSSVFSAWSMSSDNKRVAGRNSETPHLSTMSKLLSLVTWSHRRWKIVKSVHD